MFGSRVTVKQPRGRRYKLDTTAAATGVFLGYSATDRNAIYKDDATGQVKTARHVVFDEGHYMSKTAPTYEKDLLRTGEKVTASPTQPAPKPQPVQPTPTPIEAVDEILPSPTPTDGPSNPRPPNLTPTKIPYDDGDVNPTINNVSDVPTEAPVEFVLSSNPFGPSVDVPIRTRGDHKTLGLNLSTVSA